MAKTSNGRKMALFGDVDDSCTDDENDISIQEIIVDDFPVDVLSERANANGTTGTCDIVKNRANQIKSQHFCTQDDVLIDDHSKYMNMLNSRLIGSSNAVATSCDPFDDTTEQDFEANANVTGSVYAKKQKAQKLKKSAKAVVWTHSGHHGGGGDCEGFTEQSVRSSSTNRVRKWERKKVPIKTLEGEFSVFVWVSCK